MISKINLPNVGMGGWMEAHGNVCRNGSPCLCTLSASALIHPAISTFGRFLLIFFLFLVSEPFYAVPPTHLQLMRHSSIGAPTNGVQQLVHSAPMIEKCLSYVTVALKTKFEMHNPREFPGYWWLFLTQHLSHYGAGLVDER